MHTHTYVHALRVCARACKQLSAYVCTRVCAHRHLYVHASFAMMIAMCWQCLCMRIGPPSPANNRTVQWIRPPHK